MSGNFNQSGRHYRRIFRHKQCKAQLQHMSAKRDIILLLPGGTDWSSESSNRPAGFAAVYVRRHQVLSGDNVTTEVFVFPRQPGSRLSEAQGIRYPSVP